MYNKKKYVIIGVYVIINLLVLLLTKTITYSCDSIGITSIALGLFMKFQPQLFTKDKKLLYMYPIVAGVILILVTNFI